MSKEDKIRYDLVPDEFNDVALVLMAGIKQGYEPNGWKEGKKFEKEANIASIKRHLRDYRGGNISDVDSGLHPLLHVACRALMQYYLDKQKEKGYEALAEMVEENQKLGLYDNTLAALSNEEKAHIIATAYEIPTQYGYKEEDIGLRRSKILAAAYSSNLDMRLSTEDLHSTTKISEFVEERDKLTDSQKFQNSEDIQNQYAAYYRCHYDKPENKK